MSNVNLDPLAVAWRRSDLVARPMAARGVFRTVCLDPDQDLASWAWQWAAVPVWDLDDGHLVLDRPLAPVAGTAGRWRAAARLRFANARIVRFARVDIEVTLFAGNVAELSVHPRAVGAHQWGRSRQDRYFALAHRAADELARRLSTCAVAPVTALPLPASVEACAA